MGRNSKARRDAKAKERARSQARREAAGARTSAPPRDDWIRPVGSEEPRLSPLQQARSLLALAAQSRRRSDPLERQGLLALEALSTEVVDGAIEAMLLESISLNWRAGWQPVELHRQARLGCSGAAAARLVHAAIATDHAGRRATELDGRWLGQVQDLDLPPVDGRAGWVARWYRTEALDRAEALAAVIDAMANIGYLPPLDPILPPPGSQGVPVASLGIRRREGPAANPMLARVRNLLAKAESTTFEAEAIALTAKAQELITRHAIDAALLHGLGQGSQEPTTIRIPIDPPYVDAKALLLQAVAEASRCRAVLMASLAMSAVVGFPDDVDGVELMFTSLLVQAQGALASAANTAPPGTRTRSQSFRSAFLIAYAHRIGERLAEISDGLVAAAEEQAGGALLPALRSRDSDVDAAVTERFGELTSGRVRGGWDSAGAVSGRRAADAAHLNAGDLAG